MKLFVIVLCILSERYLTHVISYYRFHWFNAYFTKIKQQLSSNEFFMNPYVLLAVIILPILLLVGLILFLSEDKLFGFISLLFNVLIFYYCLGPQNPFYPINYSEMDEKETAASVYFARVNDELFAVILWYILAGPLAIILYRLLHLAAKEIETQLAAKTILAWFDWVSVRVTLLLYLLVGNFQRGFNYYTEMFLAQPERNDDFLSKGGLLAVRTQDEEMINLSQAQNLVEHALIVFLVLIALFTLAAWL